MAKLELDKISAETLNEHVQEIALCYCDIMNDPNPAAYLHAIIAAAATDILSSEVALQQCLPGEKDAPSLNRILLGMILLRAQRPLTLVRP